MAASPTAESRFEYDACGATRFTALPADACHRAGACGASAAACFSPATRAVATVPTSPTCEGVSPESRFRSARGVRRATGAQGRAARRIGDADAGARTRRRMPLPDSWRQRHGVEVTLHATGTGAGARRAHRRRDGQGEVGHPVRPGGRSGVGAARPGPARVRARVALPRSPRRARAGVDRLRTRVGGRRGRLRRAPTSSASATLDIYRTGALSLEAVEQLQAAARAFLADDLGQRPRLDSRPTASSRPTSPPAPAEVRPAAEGAGAAIIPIRG